VIRRPVPVRLELWGPMLALGLLVVACGGTQTATQSATATVTVTPAPTPTPGPTAQQLTAVAAQVYHSDGSTCEGGGGVAGGSGPTSYSSCPFTSDFAQTLAAATQAEINSLAGHGGGHNLLCHCQAAPPDYAVSSAQPSGSGGTANVRADYMPPFTFILTVVSQNGQLLISNIQVQGAMTCATPAPIATAPC
jgi:hypothetical protein